MRQRLMPTESSQFKMLNENVQRVLERIYESNRLTNDDIDELYLEGSIVTHISEHEGTIKMVTIKMIDFRKPKRANDNENESN